MGHRWRAGDRVVRVATYTYNNHTVAESYNACEYGKVLRIDSNDSTLWVEWDEPTNHVESWIDMKCCELEADYEPVTPEELQEVLVSLGQTEQTVQDAPTRQTNLTPKEDLFMEVLAARHRLGETIWTFDARHTSIAKTLEKKKLVWWKGGIVEKTIRAGMTQEGKDMYLDPSYRSPS